MTPTKTKPDTRAERAAANRSAALARITSTQRLHLAEGDVVVLQVPDSSTAEQMRNLGQAFAEHTQIPGERIVVTTNEVTIGALPRPRRYAHRRANHHRIAP